jgi:hypothetical protein
VKEKSNKEAKKKQIKGLKEKGALCSQIPEFKIQWVCTGIQRQWRGPP